MSARKLNWVLGLALIIVIGVEVAGYFTDRIALVSKQTYSAPGIDGYGESIPSATAVCDATQFRTYSGKTLTVKGHSGLVAGGAVVEIEYVKTLYGLKSDGSYSETTLWGYSNASEYGYGGTFTEPDRDLNWVTFGCDSAAVEKGMY